MPKISQTNNVKVDIYIRTVLRQLSESGYIFSEHQLQKICDSEWSKLTFKLTIPYPFARIVDGSIPISELAKDEHGYYQYWNEVFSFGKTDLLFISHWDEKNCYYFNIWLSTLSIDIRHEIKTYTQLNINSREDLDDKEKTMNIIKSMFKNGFRTSSNIDFERFQKFYLNEYNIEFSHDANWLNYLLAKEALLYDDRAYIYDKEVATSVRFYLEQMNSPCVHIDIFFNKHLKEFYSLNIFSIEMLRAYIKKNYHEISIKRGYILLQKNISPYDQIKDVFSEREVWSIDELQRRFPYLKMDTIYQTMNSPEYFRVNKGVYTHINNIDLPDFEGEKIVTFIESKLQQRNYISVNELDLSEFINLNPHCSFLAIRDAVFYKFLSDKYNKSGQVITKISEKKLCVIDIIEQYCRESNTVSFEELNAFEATLDPEGKSHSQCLIAGYNVMIRVSFELFVSDEKVHFDIEQIDKAIELYCNSDFIPLRDVTNFSLFPYTGYAWNLFLLESYLRRFSHKFKYDVRTANSSNIGVIINNNFNYSNYDDILSIALAKSSILLEDKNAVYNYLFDNGYIGLRNLGKNESKIIMNAIALRIGGKV